MPSNEKGCGNPDAFTEIYRLSLKNVGMYAEHEEWQSIGKF